MFLCRGITEEEIHKAVKRVNFCIVFTKQTVLVNGDNNQNKYS